ncbi:MAG TPA: hypothetical protein DCR97_01715 [Deltaproteobacteria bacterium]|nr:hypothetical protein [Deltaproteobacteria bacterium]
MKRSTELAVGILAVFALFIFVMTAKAVIAFDPQPEPPKEALNGTPVQNPAAASVIRHRALHSRRAYQTREVLLFPCLRGLDQN